MAYYYQKATSKDRPRRLAIAAMAALLGVLLLSVISPLANNLTIGGSPLSDHQPISYLTDKLASLDVLNLVSDSPATVTETPSGALIHKGVTATLFWAGESSSSQNAYISNAPSAWDEQWTVHYGGLDSPRGRSGSLPKKFTPKENPFYFALPYNDLTSHGKRKASATQCPNYGKVAANVSWCKNAWVKITHGKKTAYAQWEDVGPFREDDAAYVFGTTPPASKTNKHAGIDLSPAINDYLGLGDIDTVDWQFVSDEEVPGGPWKQIVTTSPSFLVE